MKGSCQCGHINFEVADDYIALVACYCTECQKVSGGVGTYSMFVAADSFVLSSGELSQWERSSASGARNIAHFCPCCSNRIYHQNPDMPALMRVKAGNLDEARKLVPDMHCWVRSAPQWIRLPEGALSYDTQPTMEEGLQALAERKSANA